MWILRTSNVLYVSLKIAKLNTLRWFRQAFFLSFRNIPFDVSSCDLLGVWYCFFALCPLRKSAKRKALLFTHQILSSKTTDFYYYLTTTHVRSLPRFAVFLWNRPQIRKICRYAKCGKITQYQAFWKEFTRCTKYYSSATATVKCQYSEWLFSGKSLQDVVAVQAFYYWNTTIGWFLQR